MAAIGIVLFTALAAGTGAGTAAAAAPDCAAGRTMYTVAHEDDSILFQVPDIQSDIAAGRCVETVFLTAGDDGLDATYWKGREQGAEAAYAELAGQPDNWTTTDAGVAGHPMPLDTLDGNPAVTLIFMRLPDGGGNGTGFASTGFESLEQLWTGQESTMTTVDGTSTYTKQSLEDTLTGLMTSFQPDTIGTQDFVGSYGDGDHPDHHSTAYLTEAAGENYTTPHTLNSYGDYGITDDPSNLSAADTAAKQSAWFAYAPFDDQACQTVAQCNSDGYASWWSREYILATEEQPVGSGGGTLALSGQTNLTAGGSVQLSVAASTGSPSVGLTTSSPGGSFSTSSGGPFTTTLTVPVTGASASFFYRDTKAGTSTVTASSNGYTSGTQTETVAAGPLASLAVSPAGPITLWIGDTQPLHATGADSFGNPVATSPTWSSTRGTFSPTSGAATTFTATSAGTGSVVATVGSITGSAAVTVATPTLTLSGAAALTAGGSVQLSAVASNGSPSVALSTSSPTGGFSTSSSGPWTATLTVPVTSGSATFFYRDTTAGTSTVTASSNGYTSSAQVETVAAGPLASLVVTPAGPISLSVGGAQFLNAAGADSFGNPVAASPTWSSTRGTFSPASGDSTQFTATSAGTGSVVATVGSVTGSTAVTVTSPTPTLSGAATSTGPTAATATTVPATNATVLQTAVARLQNELAQLQSEYADLKSRVDRIDEANQAAEDQYNADIAQGFTPPQAALDAESAALNALYSLGAFAAQT